MRATTMTGWLWVVLAGCNGGGKEDDCAPEAKFEAFVDADGDGYGVTSAGLVCRLRDGQADEDGDCDDDDARVSPGAEERCNGRDDDCDDALDDGLDQQIFFLDGDEDGYGDDRRAITACAAPELYVEDDTDCDDANPGVNPGAVEICSEGVDEDCDGLVDDDDDSVDPGSMPAWYYDGDQDGFGDVTRTQRSCLAPAGGVSSPDDCNDDRADVNPSAPEICNRRDDDCDGAVDHEDPSIDPALLIPGYADTDGDGFGDAAAPIQTCGYAPGVAAETGDDCDDTDGDINPGENDRPCDGVDNDCDPATIDNPDRDGDGTAICDGDCADLDAARHPGATEIPDDGVDTNCDGQEDCFQDLDGDGLRNEIALPGGADPDCNQAPNRPSEVPVDCDDTDPDVNWSGDWTTDADGDGFGDGAVVLTATCADPGAGYANALAPRDCDDAAPGVFPGADDPCNDGIDSDCNGSDTCRTCAEVLAADPAAATGVYDLSPDGQGRDDRVTCDMDTDGGGWTLVGAFEGFGFLDNWTTSASTGLDLRSAFTYTGIWTGLLPVVSTTSDLRFVCVLADGDAPTVDLSFYDVPWYVENAQTGCFAPGGLTPARRDNLTDDELGTGDPYATGNLLGEDYCAAWDDFTVDFTDAGMNSDESDGTDWGIDDGVVKCGTAGAGWGWYVYLRE